MVRRELILKSIVTIAIAVVLLSAAPAKADLSNYGITDTVITITQGGLLPNTTNYDWWYGCSPTSAGMMMGHYDRNGYSSLYYDNLVLGGIAESNTYGNPGALANQVIASSGHIADFWVGYGLSAPANPDPLGSGRTLPDDFDSLADFMGTSQDSEGNSDGETYFSYLISGNPYYEASSGVGEGMYGVGQYLEYAGYDAGTLYNQLLLGVADELGPYPNNTTGFTFADYKAEIDAGRPVMIQVLGHSMFGYGYEGDSTVYVYDTWGDNDGAGPHLDGQNPGIMTWGGSYGGMLHYGVMALELTGGSVVPVPAAVLLGMLGLGVVGIKLRRFA